MEDLAPKLFAKILRIPAPMLLFFFESSFCSLLTTGFADRVLNLGTLNNAGPEVFRELVNKFGMLLVGVGCECWRRKRERDREVGDISLTLSFELFVGLISFVKVLLFEDIRLDQD